MGLAFQEGPNESQQAERQGDPADPPAWIWVYAGPVCPLSVARLPPENHPESWRVFLACRDIRGLKTREDSPALAHLSTTPSLLPPWIHGGRGLAGGGRPPPASAVAADTGSGPSSFPPEGRRSEPRSEHRPSRLGARRARCWCRGPPRPGPLAAGDCAGFRCRGHRVRLDGCVPRLPTRRPQVGASSPSKPTVSSPSPLLVQEYLF